MAELQPGRYRLIQTATSEVHDTTVVGTSRLDDGDRVLCRSSDSTIPRQLDSFRYLINLDDWTVFKPNGSRVEDIQQLSHKEANALRQSHIDSSPFGPRQAEHARADDYDFVPASEQNDDEQPAPPPIEEVKASAPVVSDEDLSFEDDDAADKQGADMTEPDAAHHPMQSRSGDALRSTVHTGEPESALNKGQRGRPPKSREALNSGIQTGDAAKAEDFGTKQQP